MPAAARRPVAAVLEAVATAAAGGVLGGGAWSLLGLQWAAAVIGVVNGAISGARGVYGWRDGRGALAFVLDSTWAVPMTAAALVGHGVAFAQRGRGGFLAALSVRANRHVYTRGLRVRRGLLDFGFLGGRALSLLRRRES